MASEKKFIMTSQRQVILDEVKKTCSHPSADELYQLVRKRLPRISLGTVYRNLEILAESGMIQKLEWAGTQKRYDGTLENHYHIRCLNCGRVEDIAIGPLSVLEDIFRAVNHYEIIGYRLEVLGICLQCKNGPSERTKRKFNL